MSNQEHTFSKTVILSFFYTGVGNTISKVLNAIGIFVVLKYLSQEAFGLASLVLAFFAILQAVTEMGLGSSIIQGKELKRRELDSLFWLSLLLSLGIYLIIFLGAPLIAYFYEEPQMINLIRVHGLIVPIFTLMFVPFNMLKRELDFKEVAIITNAALFFAAVTMVTLAILGFGAWSIIIGEVVNKLVMLLLSQLFYPFWPGFQYNWEEIKDRVMFGVYATGSRLLYNLYSNADYLIVGKVFGTAAAGIYTFAYRIVSDTIKLLISNLNEVAYPAFSRLKGETERLSKYFFTIARGSLYFNGFVLILMMLYIEDLLLIAGYTKWLDAVPLVQLLALTGILRTVSPLVPQLLNAIGEARLNFYYSLSNSIIMPIAFLIGAQFSLIGVGYAWLIGYPIVVMFLFYFGSKMLNLSLFAFIRRAFSVIWILPLMYLMGFGFDLLLKSLFGPESYIAPIAGILLTFGIGVGIMYLKEKETIEILRGHVKS